MTWLYKQAFPLVSKSNRAMEFTSKQYLFCLGKATPWPNDGDTPPDPDSDIDRVPEPLLYKRPMAVLPAIQSPCGNKVLHDDRGRAVIWQVFYDRPEVLVTHVYIALEVDDGELQAGSYRVTGLYSSTILVDGAPTQPTYLPGYVLDPGVLEWVCLHSPTVKVANRKKRVVEFVIGF